MGDEGNTSVLINSLKKASIYTLVQSKEMNMEMIIGFPGGARVDARFKGYTILTDQPPHGGGEGAAPAPFDHFWASLGTCAGIYVLRFLEQRNIPTDDVHITLSTHFDAERRMVGKVSFAVELPESFPAKYSKAIVKAVNLCAVKKHIKQPPEFETIVSIGPDIAATYSD